MNDQRPSFTQLGFGALFVALIAGLLGIRLGGDTGKSADRPAATKAPLPETISTVAGNEPQRRFVLDFLYPHKVRAAAPEQVKTDAVANSKPLCVSATPARGFNQVEADKIVCLIVTVADPVDTPFGFWFDQIVESMTRAAGAFNYSPAGHWFPWEAYQRGVGNTGAKSDDEGRPPFELYPGVMLFRHRDPTRTLIVLLVGETVNGIRAKALKRALNLVHEIDRARTNHNNMIRLVAPFFSGAQAGLFQAMAEWCDGIPKGACTFDVISGSANGIDGIDPSVSASKKEERPPAPLELFKQKHRCKFRSTIIPAAIQQNVILHFLKHKTDWRSEAPQADFDLSDVAILIESNTGFGGSQQAQAKQAGDPQQAGDAQAKQARDAQARQARSPLYLTFPMRLARVQARYAEQRAAREKRVAVGDIWLPGEGLGRQPRLNPDMAPTLDEATTPRLDDRGIDDITATIRRNRIHYVGLSATDPQDVVFLVERIKRDCSRAQIFVMGMDLIYALPENRNTMRGVVIGSTYPLYPPNQEWTNPNDRFRQTFMSESAQGCYNAAVFHLTDAMPEDSLRRRSHQEYSPPVFAEPDDPATGWSNWSKPPVWVFTMGENGRYVPNGFYFYGPIATPTGIPVSREASRELMVAAQRRAPGQQGQQISVPALGAVMLPVTLLLLGAAGVLLWALSGRPTAEAPAFPHPRALLQPDRWQQLKRWWCAGMQNSERHAATWQNLALAAILVAVVPVMCTSLTLLGSSFHNRPWPAAFFLMLACAAALLVLIIATLLQVRLLQRLTRCQPKTPAERRPAGRHLAGNGLLSFVGWTLAVWLLVDWGTSDRASLVLFAERVTLVQTGYSVVPPLLVFAAGVVALAYCGTRRHDLAERFRIDCPYPESMPEAADPLTACACHRLYEEAGQLREKLASFTAFGHGRTRWLFVASIVAILATRPFSHDYRLTYEGRVWDVTFMVAFLVLTCGVVFNTLRFLVCWKGLERLLQGMALLPMVQAFERLPRKVADLFGGYFWTHRPRLSHLVIPLAILRQLRDEAARASNAQGATTAQAEADPADPALARLPGFGGSPTRIVDSLKCASAWPDPLAMKIEQDYPSKALNTLSGDAQGVIRHLAPYWPHHSIANAYGDEVPAAGGKRALENSPNMSAQRTAVHPPEEEMPCWVRKAEDFVAVQAIVFLSQFVIQLRELAAGAVSASVLLLIAATIYPFQPEQLIMCLVVALLFVVAGSIVWVLVQVNKNEIISRITRSTPNRFDLNWTFVAGMLQYVGPIVLVMILSMSGRMRTLGEPLLNLIR